MTAETLFPVEAAPISLYPWQEEAVEALRENIRNGVKNQIFAAPTGSGKTRCAAHVVNESYRKGRRAVFVCDRLPLIQQTSDTFDEYGIPHGIIQADHWRTDSYHRVQIASAQTLARRGWPDTDLIVVDECHSLHKTVTDRIGRRDVVTIGLTATPFTRGLGRLYDSVVNVRTMNQLVADRYLAPFEAYAAAEPDMEGAKVAAGEWTDAETETRALPIIGDVVAEYLEKAHPRKFIAFGVTIRHCEEMQRQFLAAGINVALYTSDTHTDAREEIVRDFRRKDGHIQGLISVAALSKGFDAPAVECIIMARPLRSSFAEHIQILGRGLRRDPDNPEKTCIVLDHSGNMMRFWRQMQDFFEYGVHELDDGKKRDRKPAEAKEPEPLKCPKCITLHRRAPMCPSCGYQYPKRSLVEHLPGKLIALGSTQPSSEGDLRADVFGQLLYVASERGYKPGWAAHKFERLFGSFDKALWRVAPREPTTKTQNWIRAEQIRWAKGRAKAGAR